MTNERLGPPFAADDDLDVVVSDLSLGEVLAAAEGLAGVTASGDEAMTTWSAGGHAFASLAGDWAEFRLEPAIARAALRTPDASDSPRGPGWVSFAPAVLDDRPGETELGKVRPDCRERDAVR